MHRIGSAASGRRESKSAKRRVKRLGKLRKHENQCKTSLILRSVAKVKSLRSVLRALSRKGQDKSCLGRRRESHEGRSKTQERPISNLNMSLSPIPRNPSRRKEVPRRHPKPSPRPRSPWCTDPRLSRLRRKKRRQMSS